LNFYDFKLEEAVLNLTYSLLFYF